MSVEKKASPISVSWVKESQQEYLVSGGRSSISYVSDEISYVNAY
jgi:hypothetical protein